MATLEQSDFGGGIYRGRKAPANSAFDIVNGLINDEGHAFRRGGDATWSTSDTIASMLSLASNYYPIPDTIRVTAWNAAKFWAFNGSNAPVLLNDVPAPPTGYVNLGRPTMVGGIAVIPASGISGSGVPGHGRILLYAGALKPTASGPYAAGTIALTQNSPTITGTGTSWLANVDPGAFITGIGVALHGVVKSVDSNTSITLMEPFLDTTTSGKSYQIDGMGFSNAGIGETTCVTAAGSGTPRVLVGTKTRVWPSAYGDPRTYDDNQFLEMTGGEIVLGMEGAGDAALVFTTGGVWRIGNLSFDAVDDAGNIQWQQAQINKDAILWHDLGIAAWSGHVIAPALDDVYLFASDGSARPISGNRYKGDAGIRPLYRSYVAAGYEPGMSAVHRGHFFLPIMNGTTLVDVLICRLDRDFAWTRWAGHAAGPGYTQMTPSTGAPKLLGISSVRVTDLTACLNTTGNAQDADATTPTFTVDSNDDDLGPGIRPDTAEKIRYVYETTGGTPTFAVSSAIGPEGTSYTAATLKRGGGASDGTDYSAWHVGRKAERIRFRFTTSSQVTSLILRRRELTVRQAGQT